MTLKSICLLPVAAVLAGGGFNFVRAATPLPVWYGESNTTRQGYEFTTASLTPAATILGNTYGTPMTTIILGFGSDGWQNPAIPEQMSGVMANGAWDLGAAGSITVECQVAANPPPPGAYYHIDFEIYVVAYRDIMPLPTFDSLGLTPHDLTFTQTTVAQDPVYSSASWEGLMWTGSFDQVTTNNIGFAVRPPVNNTSIIDTLEVFTRVTLIPEPSSIVLVILPVVCWSLRRRRP